MDPEKLLEEGFRRLAEFAAKPAKERKRIVADLVADIEKVFGKGKDEDKDPCQHCQRIAQLEDNYERMREQYHESNDRIQFMVDHWPGPLEDGGFMFPDGTFWEKSES